MISSGQHADLNVVWRNATAPHGTRRAVYREEGPEGRQYEILEHGEFSGWFVVTSLTVITGRHDSAVA